EILVIRVHRERMRCTLQISAPFLDRRDDGEHFLVVNLVVELRGGKLAGIERNRVQHAVSVGLGDDRGDGEIRGISLDRRGAVRVKMGEHRGRGECSLELHEGQAGWLVKGKRAVLLEESHEWAGDLGVGLDETPIKVGKAEEDLYIV